MLQKLITATIFQSIALADIPPLIIKGEKCPTNIINSRNLTLESLPNYAGYWYNNANTLNAFTNSKDYCPFANYTIDNSPNKFNAPSIIVDNGYTDSDTLKRRDIEGKAYFLSDGNLYVLFSKYLENFVDSLPEQGNYHVLETDAEHKEYAYIYSCTNICNKRGHCDSMPDFWINTRSQDSYDFMGQSIFDRVDYVMDLYRQMGASEYAVATAYDYWSYNQMIECDAPVGPKWDDRFQFWIEKIIEWFKNH